MAGLGDSFMLPKPGQDTEHLWVLITKPHPANHEAIMVNSGNTSGVSKSNRTR